MNSKKLTQENVDSIINLYYKGEIDIAIKSIDSLIIEYPNESVLFNLHGACIEAKGNFDFAHESYLKATIINPDFAEAHFNLAGTHHKLGDFEKSIASFQKSISIKSDFHDAHYSLGKVFQELSRLEDALKCFNKALSLQPNFAELHFNLGLTLFALGRSNDAIDHYQKCLELNPNSINANNNLGKIFHTLGKLSVAAGYFENAIELDNDFAEAHNNLGVVLQDLGQLTEALISYNNAISIFPDAKTLNNMGITYQELGKFNDAIYSFEKAISINSKYADSYHNLSYLRKISVNDAIFSKMNILYENNNLKDSDRSLICLALAKSYENLGNQNQFFHFLNQGNSLRKKELKYSIDEPIAEIAAIKKIFNPSNIIPKIKLDNITDKKIIFIIGMPRSGTTLVEQILASHKNVYGGGEVRTLTNLINPIINNFLNDDIDNIDQQTISFIQQEYCEMLTTLNVHENVITDKLPLNFKYLGFILSALPEAKIVHLNRDPIATCWSNYRCSFTQRENGYSYDFNDLIQFFKLYKDIMIFWRSLYPNQIFEINYENLTVDQEEETRKLLTYCDLEWDENCLNFHENNRAVQTASTAQVRKKMYQGSSDDWKKYWAQIRPLVDGLKSLE
jgi:tetratricopeptide (TPR) repeat protein